MVLTASSYCAPLKAGALAAAAFNPMLVFNSFARTVPVTTNPLRFSPCLTICCRSYVGIMAGIADINMVFLPKPWLINRQQLGLLPEPRPAPPATRAVILAARPSRLPVSA